VTESKIWIFKRFFFKNCGPHCKKTWVFTTLLYSSESLMSRSRIGASGKPAYTVVLSTDCLYTRLYQCHMWYIILKFLTRKASQWSQCTELFLPVVSTRTSPGALQAVIKSYNMHLMY